MIDQRSDYCPILGFMKQEEEIRRLIWRAREYDQAAHVCRRKLCRRLVGRYAFTLERQVPADVPMPDPDMCEILQVHRPRIPSLPPESLETH